MEQNLLKALNNSRTGFAGAVAILVVIVPPNLDKWLSGEISDGVLIMVTPAVAGVCRGLFAILERLCAGENPFKGMSKKEKADAEQS